MILKVYQAKLDKREAKSKESGKPTRGKSPVPPVEGAQDKDQINLTDKESRIMQVAGGGFDQCSFAARHHIASQR